MRAAKVRFGAAASGLTNIFFWGEHAFFGDRKQARRSCVVFCVGFSLTPRGFLASVVSLSSSFFFCVCVCPYPATSGFLVSRPKKKGKPEVLDTPNMRQSRLGLVRVRGPLPQTYPG